MLGKQKKLTILWRVFLRGKIFGVVRKILVFVGVITDWVIATNVTYLSFINIEIVARDDWQ